MFQRAAERQGERKARRDEAARDAAQAHLDSFQQHSKKQQEQQGLVQVLDSDEERQEEHALCASEPLQQEPQQEPQPLADAETEATREQSTAVVDYSAALDAVADLVQRRGRPTGAGKLPTAEQLGVAGRNLPRKLAQARKDAGVARREAPTPEQAL